MAQELCQIPITKYGCLVIGQQEEVEQHEGESI